ncbi:MAG TPA: alpha-mannosidase [Erysipelothrix sp.]
MKKKVHIISHSHWDREWYLPFEQHHMRLVELFDDLFEIFETDPDFDSFHLDGQTILLDDYLEVKPENEALVRKYIAEGKLKIGPFYILQDDYLISGEANARNMLVGLQESKKWGDPVMLGYFPDTFGNMGQAPQMMNQGGMKAVAFGRGVKTTGFNNLVVDEQYSTEFSEMWWEGSNKEKIFSILFANWYSNGNEIPVDKEEAIKFWDQKLADAEKFASTNHLLMMNGVDHQPVQKDVTEAIKLANELYPDYEFVHSNFDTYMEEVMGDISDDLGSVAGELTSQETDGWYTLTNTASSRLYLKQENTKVQNLLEQITEPLASMAYEVTNYYPHEKLRYAWKWLMKNHPHDSICGCSVDEVHDEMMTRFQKAEESTKFVRDEALRHLQNAIDTSAFSSDARPFIVFNTLGHNKTEVAEITIEWERLPFVAGKLPKHLYDELNNKALEPFKLVDKEGNEIPFDFVSREVLFNYDLPKDKFRQPYMATYITIRVPFKDFPGLSWDVLALVPSDQDVVEQANIKNNNVLENEYIKVTVAENGQLDILDKKQDRLFENMMRLENTGDIGNEYIFKQAANDKPLYADEYETVVTKTVETDLVEVVEIKQTMMIPKAAEDTLDYEQKSVTEMRQRTSERSKELVEFVVTTTLRLEKDNPMLKFSTHYNNVAKDHRLRVVFDTKLDVDTHVAESIYEVIERPNSVSDRWENPTNPQRMQAFVNMFNDDYGVTLANKGLPEYEVLDNRYIAITLLRATGELGDWGYFPTPGAQSLGENTMEYGLIFHDENTRFASYHHAKAFQIPFTNVQTTVKEGPLATSHQFVKLESEKAMMTALKRKENDTDLMLRVYNMDSTAPAEIKVETDHEEAYKSNLIEEYEGAFTQTELKPAEILTIGYKKGE